MANQSYFIIPNQLDTNPAYADLSVQAKYLYGKMRDTLKLSILNNWQDENGFYIRMTRINMATLLKCCLPTVRKFVKELVAAGLLIDKREGLTRSNKLYVQLLPGEDEIEFQCRARKQLHTTEKPDSSPDCNEVSSNQRNPNQRNQTQSEYIPNARDIKENRFWVLQNGAVFRDQGKWWIFENGQMNRYRFGKEQAVGTAKLLLEMGMSEDVVLDSFNQMMAEIE